MLKLLMSTKNERLKKIKNFLSMQSGPSTITEIYEALSKRMHLDISRKTIERDLIELEGLNCLSVEDGTPSKYSLKRPIEIEIVLRVEEVQEILSVLNPESELFTKLKSELD
jgi:DeoR/GlpR family transcriptional regulator of sugar metabolism